MQKTGTSQLYAEAFLSLFAGYSPTIILGAMITLSEVFNISFPHSTGQFHVSIGSPIALAAGFTLGPTLGGTVVMLALLIESLYARRAAIKTIVRLPINR